MKQPLITFSGLFALGVFCAGQGLGGKAVWLTAALCAGAFWAADKKLPGRKFRLGAWMAAGFLCGSLFFQGYTQWQVQPVRELDGQILWAEATLLDYPEVYEDGIRAQISADVSVQSQVKKKFKTMVYLPLEYQNMKPGDRLSFLAQFYQAEIYDGFDKKSYLESRGIYTLAVCKDTQGITTQAAEKLPVWAYPRMAARQIGEMAQSLYPGRTAGFLISVLLGDKSGIASQDYIAMQKAGIVHITAVSGMHVGFLTAFLLLLFGRRRGSLIAVVFVVFFVFVAGASPSVIRAALMYILMAAAYWLNREASGLNSMFFALLVILLQNPYAVFGLSLQLSFGATAGILLFAGKLCAILPGKSQRKPVQKLLTYGKQTVACSASSMIFTTPVLILSFDYISVVSMLTNFLVLPVVSLMFILGYLSCLAGLVSYAVGYGISLAVRPLAWYILSISGGIARFPYAVVFAEPSDAYLILALVYGFLLLGYCLRKKIPARFIAAGLLVLWAGVGLCGGLRSGRTSGVTVLPSGNGQTILVSGEGRQLALVDCGGSGYRDSVEKVEEWMLLHSYDRLKLLVLTAVDMTHARSAAALLQEIPVEQAVLPAKAKNEELEAEILSAAEQNGTEIIRCGNGEEELSYPDFRMQVWGDVSGKAVVQTPRLLISHSLTQNMLAEFLAARPVQAEYVAFAPGNLEKKEKLQAALAILQPQYILLESGYPDSEEIENIPVYNTYTQGELALLE